jgi:hypothetical protein
MNKLSVKDKRNLLNYLQATDNEIAIDLYCYKLLNVKVEERNYLPRPTISNKFSNKMFIKVFKLLWKFNLSTIYFIFQLTFYLIRSKKLLNDISSIKNINIGVAFSDRSFDIFNKPNNLQLPKYWCVMPWVDSSKIDKNYIKLDLLSLVTKTEIFKSFYLAKIVHKKMAKSTKYKKWITQSYTAFKWFIARFGIEKLECSYTITDHYDRNAVMMDGIVKEKHRKGIKSELNLIQHGIVTDLRTYDFSLPYKLTMLKKVYLFDKISEEIFKEKIVDKKNQKLEVQFYNKTINISEITTVNSLNILFVGHSICLDFHIHVYNELKKKYEFTAFYKPHPTEKISKKIESQNWIIIDDVNIYPKVNFLVSYNSSLVEEYKYHSINTFIHEFKTNLNSQKDYIKIIENEISKHQNIKHD